MVVELCSCAEVKKKQVDALMTIKGPHVESKVTKHEALVQFSETTVTDNDRRGQQ